MGQYVTTGPNKYLELAHRSSRPGNVELDTPDRACRSDKKCLSVGHPKRQVCCYFRCVNLTEQVSSRTEHLDTVAAGSGRVKLDVGPVGHGTRSAEPFPSPSPRRVIHPYYVIWPDFRPLH